MNLRIKDRRGAKATIGIGLALLLMGFAGFGVACALLPWWVSILTCPPALFLALLGAGGMVKGAEDLE